MQTQIIQDRFRRHYRLHTPDDVFINTGVKPQTFRDPVLTEQFVRDMRVPEDYWQRLVMRYGQWNAQPNTTPEGRISQLLIEGRIKLYPLEHANRGFAIGSTQGYPSVTTNKGLVYQLVPASILLTGATSKTKSFTSKQEVEQFLTDLGPDEIRLDNLLQASGLVGIQAKKNSTTKTTLIAQAMLDGRLVVIEKQRGVISTNEGKTEELPAQGPGNKPATLGPHEQTNKNSYPEGIAYRSDLPTHLAGPHGFKNGKLHGTHNQQNAIQALKEKGATYELTPTGTTGISELNYKYFNKDKGKYVSGRKTVYDSNIYTDQEMLDMSQSAGEKAFNLYKADNSQKFFDVQENGVNFRAYINIDPKTNSPFIGNVHPIN